MIETCSLDVSSKNIFICPIVRNSLPKGFAIRGLEKTDYEKGFLACLAELTVVGNVKKEEFNKQFDRLATGNYVIIVIENSVDKSIAAAGTIFIEDKFIHACGKVGHIEDIVVCKSIIEQLKVTGRLMGCYKIILDCSVKNVPFYEKCGFAEKEREMVLYCSENDASSQIDTGKIKSNL